jgi:hypothetical protein
MLNHPNRPMSDASLMSSCEQALAELRSVWSGSVFHAPERSARAHSEEARLIALRTLRFQPSIGDSQEIELLPGGRVLMGTGLQQHWAVVERAGTLSLQFYSNARPTETFQKVGVGIWRGVSCAPGFEIGLKECATGVPALPEDSRAPRSAEHLVAAIADPAFFAVGYDARRASALGCALSLLNDTFDDVPEQIVRVQAKYAACLHWRTFLEQTVSNLASARDRRIALVQREKKIGPRALDPAHYARPL